MRRPPLSITENALAFLVDALHEISEVTEDPPIGRIRIVGSPGGSEIPSTRRTWAMFKMVAIVEACVDGISKILFSEMLSGQSEVFSALVANAESHAYDNWSERKNVFFRYHKITLADCDNWQLVSIQVVVTRSRWLLAA